MKITYIRHATVLVESQGKIILTDPWLSGKYSFFTPQHAPGLSLSDPPKRDLILISHGHGDHLNILTLRSLQKESPVLVPKGLGKRVSSIGFTDVVELDQWQDYMLGTQKITAVPARHTPRSIGYVIEGEKTVYFAGDTVLFSGIREIADRFKIDIALLPIGGVVVLGRRLVMSPKDALEAVKILNPEIMIPIHWSTFPSIPLLFSMKGKPEELESLADSEVRKKIKIVERGRSLEL